MSSDAVGGRLTFGALALVNDTFLQMVRTETHRGLEGRALAGFATGGKTYGFTTVIEPNPPDLEHPRKVRVMADDEAKIVRQVFEMYASGTSYKGIATALNEGGVPAPHDGGKGNKNAPGWAHSTVRYMLRNEQYVGVWIWNKGPVAPDPRRPAVQKDSSPGVRAREDRASRASDRGPGGLAGRS